MLLFENFITFFELIDDFRMGIEKGICTNIIQSKRRGWKKPVTKQILIGQKRGKEWLPKNEMELTVKKHGRC